MYTKLVKKGLMYRSNPDKRLIYQPKKGKCLFGSSDAFQKGIAQPGSSNSHRKDGQLTLI